MSSLFARFKSGDEDAPKEIATHFYPLMEKYSRGDEDMCQHMWITLATRLQTKRDLFEDWDELGAYCARCLWKEQAAFNSSNQLIRVSRYHLRRGFRLHRVRIDQQRADQTGAAAGVSLDDALAACVTDEEKQIIRMVHGGSSLKEVARDCHMSRMTLYRRLDDIQNRLKRETNG